MNEQLDLHGQLIMEQYDALAPRYEELCSMVTDIVKETVASNCISVSGIESRVKTRESLAGKLSLKGSKYSSLEEVTDIVGVRVITYFLEDVDKISVLLEKLFTIDWDNSVDKRKLLDIDSFGYVSLHYICSVPRSLFFDERRPYLNEMKFELQMRTSLQHVWASMNHKLGYKFGLEVPSEHRRSLIRLAGLLELADNEYSRIRSSLTEYRRRVDSLVKDGDFDGVDLNGDTFLNYLDTLPFNALNHKIAAINQAEIQPVNSMPYLEPLLMMGFRTLGDVERMRKEESDSAYQLALFQIGSTDLDIISSSLGLHNLCLVHILHQGGGVAYIKRFLDTLGGSSEYNLSIAERIHAQAKEIKLI